MKKIDYKKELKHLYGPSAKTVQVLDVPAMQYLVVNGKDGPGGPEFAAAVEALYPVAYAIKFAVKQSGGADFVVPPLEGLWWADDWSVFIKGQRDQWQWTLMIMQPGSVTQEIFDAAISKVRTKKNPAALDKVAIETITEGRCAQILHLGPFSEEGPTIQKVHDAIEAEGCQLAGKHHEIYLSDMRRVAPEKYRTVIRQPMRYDECVTQSSSPST